MDQHRSRYARALVSIQLDFVLTQRTEEAEYSHFALTQTPLTFLRFPGLVSGRYHVSLPAAGTFSVENPGYWAAATRFLDARHHAMRAAFYGALHARALAPPRARTFTDAGMEVRVALREGAYPGFVWFGRQYAVDIAVPEAMRGNGPPMRRCVPFRYLPESRC